MECATVSVEVGIWYSNLFKLVIQHFFLFSIPCFIQHFVYMSNVFLLA